LDRMGISLSQSLTVMLTWLLLDETARSSRGVATMPVSHHFLVTYQ